VGLQTIASARKGYLVLSGLMGTAFLLGCGGSPGQAGAQVAPIRAEQAPQVTVRDVVESADLVGSRVRVAGACALAGTGPSTGAWVLQADGFAVEVRGLVPPVCARGGELGQTLMIFAQVEPKGPDSDERLLLRLPD
jgi:hypothetical protein